MTMLKGLGFRPLWRQEAREVLITWETDQRR
jgi:hypothetical protein